MDLNNRKMKNHPPPQQVFDRRSFGQAELLLLAKKASTIQCGYGKFRTIISDTCA